MNKTLQRVCFFASATVSSGVFCASVSDGAEVGNAELGQLVDPLPLRSEPLVAVCPLITLVSSYGRQTPFYYRTYFLDQPPSEEELQNVGNKEFGWKVRGLRNGLVHIDYNHYELYPQAATVVFKGYQPADVRWVVEDDGKVVCDPVVLKAIDSR